MSRIKCQNRPMETVCAIGRPGTVRRAGQVGGGAKWNDRCKLDREGGEAPAEEENDDKDVEALAD